MVTMSLEVSIYMLKYARKYKHCMNAVIIVIVLAYFRTDHLISKAEEYMSQLMPIFESLRQREDLPCSYPLAVGSTSGPHYHWVRERSVRSVPMGRSTGRSSFSGGTRTPDSLSDNESTLPRPVRKGSAPPRSGLTPGGSLPGSRAGSRAGSRPGSRQGSKPPSRHGSNLSLDSTDDGTPSRIPIQRRMTPSSGLSTPNSRTTSSATRKLTVPVNGSATGSRPRTPTGLASPASGSSSSRTRTPSGSSTPIPTGAKVVRKTSGASDTPTGLSRKGSSASTPTEKRAPFRL